MAITLNNTPLSLYLSRNQAVFRFLCPDAIATAGVQESRFAIISAAIPQDDTLTIAWSFDSVDYSVEFTFKNSPDADLYEIESNGTAPDSAYIEDTLIPGLLSHPDISQFFDIDVEQDTFFGFRLTSRVSGPISLTVVADDFTLTAGGTAGVAESREPDYLASAWLYVAPQHNSDLDEFTKLGEFELYPDADGLTDIDVQQLLDDFFTTPETPTATADAPVLCTELLRRFYLLYGQKFGDPVARKKQTRTDIFEVAKGGMTNSEFIGANGGFFKNPIRSRTLSLRLRREAGQDQEDWIFFYFSAATTDLRLRCVLHYTDGTTQTEFLWQGEDLDSGNIYQCAAGFTQAGVKALADTAEKRCYKYILTVGAGDFAPAIQPVTFYVMPYDHLEVIIEFENSLGAIESWRMTGQRSLSGNITAEQYRRALPATPDAEFQQLLSFNEQDQPIINITTGMLSKSDALAYRDLLKSRHKWIRKGTARIPFRTDPQPYDVDRESLEADYSRSYTFQAILAPERSVSAVDPVWP